MKGLPWFAMALLLCGAAQAASFEEGLALKKDNKLAEAESVFAAVVQENPDDAAALSEWATVLGWLGRFDDSIVAWKLVVEKKDSPDAEMALARVLYWKGELKPARQRLEQLLAAAPDNADALVLAGDVCAADHDFGCARADYGRAQAIAPSAEIEKKLAGAAEPPRFRFDAGGQVDDYYQGDRGTEGSFFVQGSFRVAAPVVVTGGYEQLHQFGKLDHRANVGAYVHPIDALLLSARFAVSPTADTIARWEASGGADLHVVGPLTLLSSVRHLDFSNEGVTIVGGGARIDIGRWSLSGLGGAAFSTVNDTQAFGQGKLEYSFTDAVRGYAGFARGRQAQLLLPPPVATDVTAGITWSIAASWALRFDYTW